MIAEEHAALRLNPNVDNAHGLLGVALGEKGDWDGAVAEEREVVRLNPQNGQAHDSLGVGLERTGNLSEAFQEYRMAYEINPQGRGYREAYERLARPASRP